MYMYFVCKVYAKYKCAGSQEVVIEIDHALASTKDSVDVAAQVSKLLA